MNLSQLILRTIRRNQEVKYYPAAVTAQTVGQVNADATGHNTITFDWPTAGTSYTDRIGAMIEIESFTIRAQIFSMASTASRVNLRHVLFFVKGQDASPQVDEVFWRNEAVYDLNTVAIYDYGVFFYTQATATYRKLAEWRSSLATDLAVESSGVNNPATNWSKEIRLNGMKIKWDRTNQSNGYFVLYTFADNGNRHASTDSTLSGIPTVLKATGVTMEISTMLRFRDA